MKEPHDEGVANHIGPESCAVHRKARREALTGENAGQVWSSEITTTGVPTLLNDGEGHTGSSAKRELFPDPAESETLSTRGRFLHGNREIPMLSAAADRPEKAIRRTSGMHGVGKSDSRIVPRSPSNNGEASLTSPEVKDRSPAETEEGRRLAKRNSDQTATSRTQCRSGVSNGLERVREAARRDRRARFTALLHHLTTELLRESFRELKKEAVPGIDGVTWRQYEAQLDERLGDLHERVHRGTYRALPSRRAYIPKADGRERPLGICCLEDKIVQKAIVKVLNSIYEVDFLGFSYGFRPQRGPHDGLDALSVGITDRKVNWVLDADIRGFFDTLDHGWLMKFAEHRIGDRRVLRLIAKWLKAGILEGGVWSRTAEGTPQGAVISPLLGNVYLHYVFDLWVNHWRKVHARGDVIVVRYADDFVLGFQHREEAERFLHDLRERLGRFGLALHPDKTRLIEFGRFAASNRDERGRGKPETFDFLGFTHLCGRTRKGRFTVRRKPVAKRLRAKLAEIKALLMRRRHTSLATQGRWLAGVLRGYFNYFAVPGTSRCLDAFRTEVMRHWLRALRRRSQRARVRWATFGPRARQWLARPRILHPYPSTRFYATHSRQEPYAVAPHVRICAGGTG